MKNLTFKELLQKMKEKKQDYYFYLFKKNKDNCFGKCYKKNIANVNLLIKNANCNNTGAKIANGFNIAFDLFYGKKHNHKLIEGRPKEISKLTTRLDKEQILEIKEKLSLWSKDIDRILPCKQKATIVSRLRIYHTFCILVNSGMRIGEFVSIDFKIDISKLRTIESRITGEKFVEMIINTEKTKKKREIYMPVESFEFLKEDN
jgi:intergrase/recombinase